MVSWLQKIRSGNEPRAELENDEMTVQTIAIAIEKTVHHSINHRKKILCNLYYITIHRF